MNQLSYCLGSCSHEDCSEVSNLCPGYACPSILIQGISILCRSNWLASTITQHLVLHTSYWGDFHDRQRGQVPELVVGLFVIPAILLKMGKSRPVIVGYWVVG
jgi:hypothetical protein